MTERLSQREHLMSIAKTGLTMSAEHDRAASRAPEASQIRAARALLNWSSVELAKASGLTVAMIGKIEAGTVHPSPKVMRALQKAFDAAGVILIASGQGVDEGLGVRLRKVEQ